MSLEINIPLYSKLELLENEFLGFQVEPKTFFERVYYELIQDDIVEVYRNRDKSKIIETDNLISSINYDEFDAESFSSLIFDYQKWLLEEKIPEAISLVDSYIAKEGEDISLKKFVLRTFINKLVECLDELNKIEQESLNKSQRNILNVFIEGYNFLLERLNHQKYSFLKLQIEDDVTKENQSVLPDIKSTGFYKELLNLGFVEVLRNKYRNSDKIIATLGRSMDYGGYNISIQTQYYTFCHLIGFIEHLENKFYNNSSLIGKTLCKISSFPDTSKNNFKRYYEARLNPNHNARHYALKEVNISFVEEILHKLTKK